MENVSLDYRNEDAPIEKTNSCSHMQHKCPQISMFSGDTIFFFFFFPLVWFSGHLWQIMCDQNKLVGESWRHLFSVKHLSKWFPTDDEKEIWMYCLLVTIIQKGYCKDNSLHNLDRIFLHLFFLSKGVVKIYLQEWKWENFRKIRTFRWSDLHKYI